MCSKEKAGMPARSLACSTVMPQMLPSRSISKSVFSSRSRVSATSAERSRCTAYQYLGNILFSRLKRPVEECVMDRFTIWQSDAEISSFHFRNLRPSTDETGTLGQSPSLPDRFYAE